MKLNSNDQQVHEKALTLSKEFRRAEYELIEILQKVEDAKIHLALGFSSLFVYATESLGLSENNAYNFTSIARKAKSIPELKEKIRSGDLSVSKAKRILSVVTPQNKNEWIEKAITMPKAQLEKEVIKVNP